MPRMLSRAEDSNPVLSPKGFVPRGNPSKQHPGLKVFARTLLMMSPCAGTTWGPWEVLSQVQICSPTAPDVPHCTHMRACTHAQVHAHPSSPSLLPHIHLRIPPTRDVVCGIWICTEGRLWAVGRGLWHIRKGRESRRRRAEGKRRPESSVLVAKPSGG